MLPARDAHPGGGVRVVTGFAAAVEEYEALLDRVEAALDHGDWSAFETPALEPPAVEGDLDPEVEERLRAVVARGVAVRERLQRAVAGVAAELAEGPRRHEAHRRYVES